MVIESPEVDLLEIPVPEVALPKLLIPPSGLRSANDNRRSRAHPVARKRQPPRIRNGAVDYQVTMRGFDPGGDLDPGDGDYTDPDDDDIDPDDNTDPDDDDDDD